MKKLIYMALLGLILPTISKAQSSDSFYDDILINEEMRQQEVQKTQEQEKQNKIMKVRQEATKLLESEAPKIKIIHPELPDQPQLSSQLQRRSEIDHLLPAPLGLNWGASILDTEDQGVQLTPLASKEQANSFSAYNLPKPLKGFTQTELVFGLENALWRITSYEEAQSDTPQASRVLYRYKYLSRLLKQKYPNHKQHFTPKKLDSEEQKRSREPKDPALINPIGNDNFLQQLKDHEAELYSVFESSSVGVSLAIRVNEEGNTFLIIDYKNLDLMKKRDTETLDIL